MSILENWYIGPRAKIIVVAVIIAAICAVYTFKHRYFLRFVPIPLSAFEIINKDSKLFPAYLPSKINGRIDFPNDDLRTEEGLRKVLNAIQLMSPFASVDGVKKVDHGTFEKWAKQLTKKPFYCTGATQLFMVAASQQGLMAREWHLLPPGWPSGIGHSVAEFYNPMTKLWQLVDAQHATIIRDKTGKILDMVSVIQDYKNKHGANIRFDYGRYKNAMLNGARGPSTASYFFKHELLRTPILQLRAPSWFATLPKKFGLSGHFIIGYPIMVDGWTHDDRVWQTKATAIGIIVFGMIAIIALLTGRRRRTIS